MNQPNTDSDPPLPEISLQITSEPVVARPRKLATRWSAGTADDFLDFFGYKAYPRLPDNDLDRLRDALEDPNYDPTKGNYEGLWRWEDGRVATPEEVKAARPDVSLVKIMSDELADEVDREILNSLSTQKPS